MIYSSSLFVIITTGKLACNCLISDNVSKPLIPGIFSSKKMISKLEFLTNSIASVPLVQEVRL